MAGFEETTIRNTLLPAAPVARVVPSQPTHYEVLQSILNPSPELHELGDGKFCPRSRMAS